MPDRAIPPQPTAIRRERLGPWRELLVLPNGRTVLLRPIDPRDAEPLRAAFATLSPEEVRFRFMHPIKEMSLRMARELTVLDPKVSFALAVSEPEPPGEGLVGAVVRAGIDPDGHGAEFALIVSRQLAGHGLGTLLMKRIIDWCRRMGLDKVYGDVLADNAAMLHITDKLGFRRSHVQGEGGVVHVRLDLRRRGARAS
ncbi:MAG: GNAT family N-acetyltransferase [Pseudomonadota bacterium]|jgi:RimJ/RimL family protein N-acetyltransferase